MAHEIEWSDEAIADVEALAEYIARSSPANADRVVVAIRTSTLKLTDFPHAHRIIPEFADPSRRETFVHRWRLMYSILPDRIRIVGVIHGNRPLDTIDGRAFEEAPQQEYLAS